MSYADAVDRLYSLAGELHVAAGGVRRKFDLEQMRLLMHALGDPQQDFQSVLIAGTNGKGSTAATLASIVAAAGYKVGLYTSPHLVRVNERIQLLHWDDGSILPAAIVIAALIPDAAFGSIFERVDAVAGQLLRDGVLPTAPSFFEALTAMAFCFFADQNVDLAVLEVGMGGRLDATNIVHPLLSIITDISLDHTEWLGPTVGAIAREKAGILRRGGTMVALPQHPEANQVLGEVAVPLDVKGVSATEYIPSRSIDSGTNENRYPVEWRGETLTVDSPLAGQHQQRNIALALAAAAELTAVHGYAIGAQAVTIGIRQTQWPGRLERISAMKTQSHLLLDVGHNPAGAWALRMALSHLPEAEKLSTIIFGCLADKPVEELAQILFPLFDLVVLTTLPSPRSATAERLLRAAQLTGISTRLAESVEDALAIANLHTPAQGLTVVTGSVLLVGAVRAMLKTDKKGNAFTEVRQLV